MAKTTGKAAVRKAPNAAAAAIKPVKQTLTRSALINLIAEENEIPGRPPPVSLRDAREPVPWLRPSAWRR